MGLCEHLEEQIAEDIKLLKQYEDELRHEADPALKGRWNARIEELKQRVREHEEELRSLFASSVQPEPVTSESRQKLPTPVVLLKNSRTSTVISRKQFLKWAVFGGSGVITALLFRLCDSIKIPKDPEPTPKPTTPSESTDKPPAISVDEPKYIEPTKDGDRFAGLPLWTVEFETVTVNAKGEKVSRSTHQAKFFKEDLGNGVILEMVSIPAGEFEMGSPSGENNRDGDESPQHKVSVPAFFMGKFAVTQAQYQQVIGSNPSYFPGDNRPVEKVLWNEAMEFCQKLSEKTGRNYRLPSEAEWEYACRAGTTTSFHFGPTLTSNLANYRGTSTYQSEPKGEYRKQTTEVGSFPPNAFGLYDMHGNVWEWCLDHFHDNYQGAPSDGSAWFSNNDNGYRVLRGGSWYVVPWYCRSADRGWIDPVVRFNNVGLRLVCSSE